MARYHAITDAVRSAEGKMGLLRETMRLRNASEITELKDQLRTIALMREMTNAPDARAFLHLTGGGALGTLPLNSADTDAILCARQEIVAAELRRLGVEVATKENDDGR